MGSNREIKSDGSVNITSTQTNISGDLDVTGSINNFTFPADGSAGEPLVTDGAGTLSFSGTVACRVYLSGDHTVSTSSETVIPFDTVDFDTHSAFSTGSHKYVVPVSGIYQVTAGMFLHGAGNNDYYRIRIYKSGVGSTDEVDNVRTLSYSESAGNAYDDVADIFQLEKDDEIFVSTETQSDASYVIESQSGYTKFAIARLK